MRYLGRPLARAQFNASMAPDTTNSEFTAANVSAADAGAAPAIVGGIE